MLCVVVMVVVDWVWDGMQVSAKGGGVAMQGTLFGLGLGLGRLRDLLCSARLGCVWGGWKKEAEDLQRRKAKLMCQRRR